jgi:hypothetical protein
MATQVIRFLAPPNQTVTLSVFTLASDTAVVADNACTEETNRKGLYTTSFTGTATGRHLLVKKVSGTAIGNDFATLANADGTYDAEGLANLESLSNAVVGKQNVTDNGNGTFDIAIRNAADDATLVTVRYNPTTGVKTVL